CNNRYVTDKAALLDELAQLKTTVEKLETEKTRYKTRIKELNEENASLQRRSNDISNFGSEREDSPDALSEIDKQEELLNNISTKNKHIKRLLRDIASLESQCASKSTQVDELKVTLLDATKNLTLITNQMDEYRLKIKEQDSTIDSLNKRTVELEQHMMDVENEKQEREFELQEFGKQLENRALVWKQMLEEKNERLDSLRTKYDEILNVNPGYNIDADRVEMRRLTEAIRERDQIITDLETKLNELSKELVDSTDMMNKLARERERTQESATKTQQKSCCDDIKLMLENSTKRCQELQEIITNLEEANVHKSKQAMDALEALQSYQNGEDGLSQAIKKNTELHSKVQSRDKQIRALVMELNSLQNEAQENVVLRKRLGIPEDEYVSTNTLSARQRRFEKTNERLMLKLRASEEMRLQLKLDKNDLKRVIDQLRNRTDHDADSVDVAIGKGESEVKYCEKCLAKYNVPENGAKCDRCVAKQNCNYCENCQKQMKIGSDGNTAELNSQILEWESKYTMVVEENENLLLGMHNILEKLRNYDAESDHVVIDTTILEKLLHALDARSVSGWYHPAMRIQNELIASKEREYALKERCRISEKILEKSDKSDRPVPKARQSLKSQPNTVQGVQGVNADGDDVAKGSEKVINERVQQFGSLYQHILDQEAEIEKLRLELAEAVSKQRENEMKIDELKEYESQFNELTEITKTTDETKDSTLAEQSEQMVQLKNAINCEVKKTKFAQEDYEDLSKIHKQTKEKLNRLMFELRRELIESRKLYSDHKIKQTKMEPLATDDKNEIAALRTELNNLKTKTSYLNSEILKDVKTLDVDNETGLNFERIEKLGVVRNNFVVDFITRTEYEDLESRCNALSTRNDELTAHSDHLEKLLNLSQEQIKSQQQILARASEEEINLRHLVVDMQATSNEKYIIAKLSRELQQTQELHDLSERESKSMSDEIARLQQELEAVKNDLDERQEAFRKKNAENDFKLKFLSKTFKELRQSYHEYMPMYPVNDFLADFVQVIECKKKLNKKIEDTNQMDHQLQVDEYLRLANDSLGSDAMENKITMIKLQTHTTHLEQQNKGLQQQIQNLTAELEQHIQREVTGTEHWNIIKLLFEDNRNENCEMLEKGTQALVGTSDKETNTDQSNEPHTPPVATQTLSPQHTSTIKTTSATATTPMQDNSLALSNENTQRSMESQLKQAMSLASTRSSLLLETENRLAIAQGRIKLLERNLEEKEKQLKEERDKLSRAQSPRKDDNILSVTITSLQNLLLEKDTTLSRYQDLLRNERQDRLKSFDDHRNEVKLLQNTVDDLEVKLRMKDRENEKLMARMKDMEGKSVAVPVTDVSVFEEEFSQMSDKHIEDMFLNERQVTFSNEPDVDSTDSKAKVQTLERDLEKLQAKLRDVRNRENFLEKTLMEKDKEIASLNERISDQDIEYKDMSENILNSREIDQLKEMLEEKDRHIGDLTDTLTHFHDDQQKFINDTSLHSAEQVAQLSADLNRCEATNRILNTQLEAMKRQIVNISQREGQAREMVKSLKTQLMKRPVISVKSDRNYSNREDILQKRLNQIENELLSTKEELRKQTALAQNRRTKDAAELSLWDKQKRFQQLSDNLKIKLAERERELEKLNSHFSTAKTTIARLEREKNLLENRLRAGKKSYCLAPSCPNLHSSKYTPAESPESCQTSDYGDGSSMRDKRLDISDNNQELLDALKSRIEMQQRKIVAMELEGKGSNAVTSEIEKLHEKLSACEAQNVRLEARNLQLQLDYDMLKQDDNSERTKRQIKHLEDYILALKGELAQSLSSTHKPTSNSNNSTGQMEQTILSLRRIVERLKVENKNLKEGKGQNASKGTVSKDNTTKLRQELDKIQQSYSEALDKVSTLQIELDMRTGLCKNCKSRNAGTSEAVDSTVETLKEKLIKKTQLLEKAKILLSRAAAKEKNFREQIIFWKRRCSELQNVPVIDEASE
ncbi:centrosomal protein cep290, partial [Bradysia coprophila]|uniref:centrosomal protein cep290 n=1 Tax=Bradysia coprophila TaxID=38358 RepID=UPI00187DAC9E